MSHQRHRTAFHARVRLQADLSSDTLRVTGNTNR
jgi:hypothetical protein